MVPWGTPQCAELGLRIPEAGSCPVEILTKQVRRATTQSIGHAIGRCPLWTLLDTTPEGRGADWYPSLRYPR